MSDKKELRPMTNVDDGSAGKLPQLNVVITVGAEATNDIQLTIQLYDWETEVTEEYLLEYWISDSAGGVVSACSGSSAVATGLEIQELTNHGHYKTMTDDTGEIIHTFQQTGDATKYCNVRLPSGKVVSSTVMTFTT